MLILNDGINSSTLRARWRQCITTGNGGGGSGGGGGNGDAGSGGGGSIGSVNL